MANTETGDRFANATPRPWHIYEGGNFVRIGAEGYNEFIERKHYLGGPLAVAEAHYNATENYEADHDKAMANARLIVEAVNSYAPSDAEQLSELRRVGERVLKVLEMHKERHLLPQHFLNAIADLRDVLAGVTRVATVQCADCLTWFDKNANHTCRQQVRRNQRSAR